MALSAPLGKGSINYGPIVTVAKKVGVRNYIVEQEPDLSAPPAETLKIDYEYLNSPLSG